MTTSTFDPSAGTSFLSKSRRNKSSHSNNGSAIAPDRNCGKVSVIPVRNTTKYTPRTISDICADATFAAQTDALKKWQARERGRLLTLKIAAMLQANVARMEVAPMTMAEEVEQLITGGKKWKNGESVWLTDRVFVKNNSHSISIDVIVSTPAKPFKPPVPCGKIAFLSMKDGQAWKLRNDWKLAVSKAEKLVGVGG